MNEQVGLGPDEQLGDRREALAQAIHDPPQLGLRGGLVGLLEDQADGRRDPMKAGMLRKQLVALGHGAALDRGAMEDFVAWRLAFQHDTDSMRHERDMVKAGITFEDGELSDMDRPTLMVFGTADPTGTADIWRGFVGDLPRGELRLINDAGHTPWWGAPSEVAGHVQQFLDRPA